MEQAEHDQMYRRRMAQLATALELFPQVTTRLYCDNFQIFVDESADRLTQALVHGLVRQFQIDTKYTPRPLFRPPTSN